MPCRCAPAIRVRRLSSSRNFLALRKSQVPKGGWTNREYRTARGAKLMQDFVKVRKVATHRGMVRISGYLKKKFTETINVIIDTVMSQKISMGQSRDAEHQGDSVLWAKAADEAIRNFNVSLVAEAGPLLQSVATEVFKKTTVLLIGEGKSLQITGSKSVTLLAEQTAELAKLITGINETTRSQIAEIIIEGLTEGFSVSQVALNLRDALPVDMWSRIPTIARTEMGRAADKGSAIAMKESGVIATVMVVGCTAIEPNIPTYHGVPTCNITNVPVVDADILTFHINHQGCIVPETFTEENPEVPTEETPPTDAPPPIAKAVTAEFGATVADSLTTDEYSATEKFTTDAGYALAVAAVIALLAGTGTDEQQGYVDDLESTFGKLPNVQGPVYRMVPLTALFTVEIALALYFIGAIIMESNFTSASESPSLFTDAENSVEFIIESKTASLIAPFSDNPNDKEVIFSPATQFKVTAVQAMANNVLRVYLQEI